MILVLEASTTSAKAMVYHPEKGTIRVLSKPYANAGEDRSLLDAGTVWRDILELGRQVVWDCKEEIELVSLCSVWHSLLLCGPDGEPCGPIYSWADVSAAETTAEIRRDREFTRLLYRCSGCMVHAMYPLYKLIHLRRQGMELGDKFAFCQGSYLFFKLTGERLTSDFIAAGTSLLDVAERRYAPRLLAMTGMAEAQFPRLCNCRETRPLREESARLLGLRAGIPVMVPGPDGGLNQVGAGALHPGEMTLSVGTSGALRVSVPRPTFSLEGGTWCYLAPDGWLCGSATASAAGCVDWLAKGVLGGRSSYAELERELTPHRGMPYFLPFINGERCPGWRDERRAVFWGLGAENGAAELYYAVLEGVLFNLFQWYEELVELCGAPDTIRVSGGICKSNFWLQMLADIWQRELVVSNNEQASMLGAAVLGMQVLGKLERLEHYRPSGDRVILPDPCMAEYYRQRFHEWSKVYQQ